MSPPPPGPETVRGLTETDARERLARTGPNALPPPPRRNLVRFLLDVFREPVFLLLIGAAGLYLALGEFAEGALMVVCAGVSVTLVAVQSWRSEKVMRALATLAGPLARVVRDGHARRIAARELVPGDAIVLVAGDRVPADAVARSAAGLVVDESALTGESVPVTKTALASAAAVPADPPGGDGTPLLFSGTLVLAGEGVAEVTATGASTAFGRIGTAIAAYAWRPTPLQEAMGRFVRRLALAALGLSLGVALLYGTLRGDWIAAALAGITLAMSTIPEELPMVLAIFLAVGAWRLSTRGVLARQPAAVLALGATTVLCLDKTGTITENRIRLESVAAGDRLAAVDPAGAGGDAIAALLVTAARACHPQGGDPLDRAMLAAAAAPAGVPLREFPLTAARPLVAFAWAEGDGVVVAAKGAPEAIAALCRLDDAACRRLLAGVDALAARGLRVLAVAGAAHAAVPDALDGCAFGFVGLLGFGDPIRDTARASITECREAGIAVAMITGDYPTTARAIAVQAGIDASGRLLDGASIAALDDTALRAAVADVRIFARVLPEQKLRIVDAFKFRGEIVAMTGDGVNDAPALRAAHVGLAMGTRGSDVAREAAGLVVLNDDLRSVADAIREGRRIADNLRKVITYIAAVHVPIVGLAVLPLLVGWPLLLHPAHVIFLELVIDPVCAVVFEAERGEPGLMRRAPRPASRTVGSRRTLAIGIAQGLALLLAVAVLFGAAIAAGTPEDEARSLAYLALVAGNLALAFTNLEWSARSGAVSFRLPPALAVATGATALAMLIVLGLPEARSLFRFAPLGGAGIALALAVGLAGVLWFEIVKRAGARALAA